MFSWIFIDRTFKTGRKKDFDENGLCNYVQHKRLQIIITR